MQSVSWAGCPLPFGMVMKPGQLINVYGFHENSPNRFHVTPPCQAAVHTLLLCILFLLEVSCSCLLG